METHKELLDRMQLATTDLTDLTAKLGLDNTLAEHKRLLKKLIEVSREVHESAIILSYIKFLQEHAQELPNPIAETNSKLPQTPNKIPNETINASPTTKITAPQTIIPEQITPPETTKEVTHTQEITIENTIETNNTNISTSETFTQVYSESKTWYDQFTQQAHEDKSLAGMLSKQKITDLTTHIGINEKFLFVNELFNNNTELFMKSIGKLNALNNFEEAIELLYQFKNELAWDESSLAFEKIRSLVERRYV